MNENEKKNVSSNNETDSYYKVTDNYLEKYYQLPKWLFTQKKYSHLNSDAKIAYTLLRDRNTYSIKNHWFDENGNIYFIYTNAQLADMLAVSETTVKRIKKQLEKVNLLKIKKMGFNSITKSNEPSRLYLLKPVLSATDVYNILSQNANEVPSSLQQSGGVNLTPPKNSKDESSSLQQSGGVNLTPPKKVPSSLQQSGGSKSALNQYYYLENTKKIQEDTKLDFSTSKYTPQEIEQQNQDLVKNASDYYTNLDYQNKFILNKEGMDILSLWCRTPSQLYRSIQIILNAKRSAINELEKMGMSNAKYILNIDGNQKLTDRDREVFKELGIDINRLPNEITFTLRKILNSIRRKSDYGKKIDPENYMFIAFKTSFKEYAETIQREMDYFNNWHDNDEGEDE